MKSTNDGTNFHIEIDDQDIVLKYFHLIDKKDMPGLLSLFTEDCRVYEPLGRSLQSNEEKEKTPLKGRNEIESFFYVVMLATDGLKHEIEFVCSSIENTREMDDDADNSGPSSVVSVLVTFYGNDRGNKLIQKLDFYIVSEQKYDTLDKIMHFDNDKNINIDTRKIESLCVHFSG
jgi:hypothetical protein